MSLFVGTSGFAYTEWKPDFYPADLPQKGFLGYYSSKLDACEINATFYKIQTPETFTRWTEHTRPDFRFAIKAHRRITHSRKLAMDEERAVFMKTFLGSLEPLGHRLAIILYQFPPSRVRDDEGLASLLDAHPAGLPFACEFRHESWSDDAVARMILDRGTICVSDTTGEVPERLPGGPVGYLRMRSERYTEEQRAGWLSLLMREAQDRDLYAFTKHEGIPAGDPYGGIGLAQWLVSQRGHILEPSVFPMHGSPTPDQP
jgi:uncharacterized protein YecE (DUF72 family)